MTIRRLNGLKCPRERLPRLAPTKWFRYPGIDDTLWGYSYPHSLEVTSMGEGISLQQYLCQKDDHPDHSMLATFIARMSLSLHRLSALGWAHGGFIPENIRVSSDNLVSLCAPSFIEDLVFPAEIYKDPIWHLPYLAPEIKRGELPTTASDIYSFAAILYKLLTGEPPCQGKMPGKALTPRLYKTLRRALDVDPSRRFRSALELANALSSETVLQVDPSGSLDHQRIASEHFRRKEYEKASKKWQIAHHLDPFDPVVLTHIGLIRAQNYGWTDARSWLERAGDGLHAHPLWNLNYAICLLSLKDYHSALFHLRRSLALGCRSPLLYRALAEVCLLEGQLEKAERALCTAIAEDRACSLAYARLGAVLRQQGRPQEASICENTANTLRASIERKELKEIWLHEPDGAEPLGCQAIPLEESPDWRPGFQYRSPDDFADFENQPSPLPRPPSIKTAHEVLEPPKPWE